MKLLMIATALLVLSGCERAVEVERLSEERQQEQVTKPAEFTRTRADHSLSWLNIVTDERTGCQYIESGIQGGLTPRMNADGTQYCRKGQVTP